MQLKAGKQYVTRNGKITGPLIATGFMVWKYKDSSNNIVYNKYGRISEQYEYPQDIVKEFKP